MPTDIIRVSLSFEESDVEVVSPPYPAGWNAFAPAIGTQKFGDRWIREARSLALEVQSVIVPDEKNVVINPLHPRFADAKTSPLIDYPLDSRRLGRSTSAK